jgi:phage shock protein PspC (stress-responsive transcriptional regulator)
MITGVSGWVAKKVNMQEKHVRLLFLVGTLVAGMGITVYIILWIVKLILKE